MKSVLFFILKISMALLWFIISFPFSVIGSTLNRSAVQGNKRNKDNEYIYYDIYDNKNYKK